LARALTLCRQAVAMFSIAVRFQALTCVGCALYFVGSSASVIPTDFFKRDLGFKTG